MNDHVSTKRLSQKRVRLLIGRLGSASAEREAVERASCEV
jgi:hypothetical protein